MTKPQVRTRKRVQPLPTNNPDFSCNALHDDLRIAVRYERSDELKPPKRILRKHNGRQIEMIMASIRGHGFNNPILVNSANEIVSGYGRWLAATALGMVEVPVIVLEHLTPEQLRLYAIADNRIAEQSEFDLGELKLELGELDGLELNLDLSGFSTSEIDDMLVAPDDEPPAGGDRAKAVAITRPGDLWQLGEHKLICASSLEADTFVTLLGSEKAAMVFADAPYNLPSSAISGMGKHHHADFAMAAGEMSKAEFTAFLATSFQHLVEYSEDGSIHFQCMDWRHMGEMLAAGEQEYTELKNLVIYTKQSAGMGTFYRSQHELIFVWKNGTAPHTNNFGLGETGRHRSNVWTYKGNSGFHRGRDEDLAAHPTVKSLNLVADATRDCSKRGAIILDPFGGSGTTLLAAERTRRRARLIELDPIYCDVTIRRWEKLTGIAAVLATTGQTFLKTAEERGDILDDLDAGADNKEALDDDRSDEGEDA